MHKLFRRRFFLYHFAALICITMKAKKTEPSLYTITRRTLQSLMRGTCDVMDTWEIGFRWCIRTEPLSVVKWFIELVADNAVKRGWTAYCLRAEIKRLTIFVRFFEILVCTGIVKAELSIWDQSQFGFKGFFQSAGIFNSILSIGPVFLPIPGFTSVPAGQIVLSPQSHSLI